MEDNTMDFQNTDLRGGAFRSPPKSLARSHAAQHWKLTALPRFPAADKIKSSRICWKHPASSLRLWWKCRDGTANITLNLMMSFGARIPAVAEKVQENVKNAVQNMTNVTVSRVNLVIAGLAETTAAEK